MNWQDERWIKLYVRSSPDFLALSWQARGLFRLLMTEVDMAGILELGKLGLKAVAVAVRAPWAEVEGPLQELVTDGCIAIVARDATVTACDSDVTNRDATLVMPNFVEAQEASQSDAARQAKRRARLRAAVTGRDGAVTERDESVTQRDASVTESHEASRAVTTSRSEEKRIEEKRSEQRPDHSASAPRPAARARAPKEPNPETEGWRAVKAAYEQAYLDTRGATAPFDGRDGKAINVLLGKLGKDHERACRIVRKAFASGWWSDKASLSQIAADPARFEVNGKEPANGGKQLALVQPARAGHHWPQRGPEEFSNAK